MKFTPLLALNVIPWTQNHGAFLSNQLIFRMNSFPFSNNKISIIVSLTEFPCLVYDIILVLQDGV